MALRAQYCCLSAHPLQAKREIGCSELYNMVESIGGATGGLQEAVAAPDSTGTPAREAEAVQAASPTQPPKPQLGADYYSGLLTSGLTVDNGAKGEDMLKRSLQFAGYSAALIGGLLLAFLASNGLV